jgi:predicted RNA-binding protein YlxR (DUF448 family)
MPATRHEPVRTCVGCREEAGKRGLIRLVRGPDGTIRADPTGRAQGRGAYLHADPGCLALARSRRALERSLKADVPPAIWEELTTGQ